MRAQVPATDILLSIKHMLSGMLEYFDKDQRCFYIDYPLHTNVGDLLINAGNEQFFSDHHVNIVRRYSYYDFFSRITDVIDTDVFLLHGGGNLGDLWFNFQSFREAIMKQYPRNRIIFLPQTVHFSSLAAAEAAVARMNEHSNFHVFVRDYQSLSLLQHLGLRSVSAMPDPAHALAGSLYASNLCEPSGELYFFRRDRESAIPSPTGSSTLPCSYDWDHGTFSFGRRLLHYGIVNVVKGVGRYGPAIDCHAVWYWHRDQMIDDGVRLFSRYEHIMTDRLHGMILALLLNRRVTAIDNHYGKLSSYYDSWLRDIPNLTFRREANRPRLTNIA